MTTLLAWRNLMHDKVRFTATLIGVVFSVTLMAIQAGLMIGFSGTAAGLVTNSRADLWLAARGTLNVDQATVLQERTVYKALRNPGIAEFARMIVRYVIWRKPSGATELIILVGFDPKTGMGGPWNIVEGSRDQLSDPNAIMIDRLYAAKLGVTELGQEIEISARKARVVGFTDGVRTFTQSPYVFTSYNNALRYTDMLDGNASYVLIRTAPGSDPAALAAEIRDTVPNVDALTNDEFARKTQNYWLFTTGAGTSLALGGVLGALVGIVIVAQTLYAATMERLPEYATLGAMGAKTGYLNAIVVKQALIAGALGYGVAVVIALGVAFASARSPALVVLPPDTLALIGVVAIGMCAASSLLAIRKLASIDPTSVFR